MEIQTVQFAGHSAIFLHGANFTAAIDPWLEGNPACPTALKNPERLDLIILTHGHSDHAGDTVRLAKKYNCKVVAMFELGNILAGEGVAEDNIVRTNTGGTVEVDGLKISYTEALHSSSFKSSKGDLYAGEPCGVVVRDGSVSLYHAGDTALFSDMSLIKDSYSPQIAFLPIGDRLTMGPKDAAKAAKLVGAKTAIPLHYKTFPMLTGTAEQFSEECSQFGVRCVAMEPSECIAISKLK